MTIEQCNVKKFIRVIPQKIEKSSFLQMFSKLDKFQNVILNCRHFIQFPRIRYRNCYNFLWNISLLISNFEKEQVFLNNFKLPTSSIIELDQTSLQLV